MFSGAEGFGQGINGEPMKKKSKLEIEGWKLVPGSVGVILDSIWVEYNQIIIKSAFGGQWTWAETPSGQIETISREEVEE